jgi:hypothetical protein
MLKLTSFFALMASVTGCYAATRSTVDLGQAEQNMAAARAAGAPEQAVYAWTMADEYMKKARDEWARSDFETADAMIAKAKQWADEAASISRAGGSGPKWGVEEALQDAPSPEEPEPAPAEATTPGVWQ